MGQPTKATLRQRGAHGTAISRNHLLIKLYICLPPREIAAQFQCCNNPAATQLLVSQYFHPCVYLQFSILTLSPHCNSASHSEPDTVSMF